MWLSCSKFPGLLKNGQKDLCTCSRSQENGKKKVGQIIWVNLDLTIFTSCIGSYNNYNKIDMCRHIQINLKHHLVHLRSLIMICLSWSSITWSALTQSGGCLVWVWKFPAWVGCRCPVNPSLMLHNVAMASGSMFCHPYWFLESHFVSSKIKYWTDNVYISENYLFFPRIYMTFRQKIVDYPLI